MQLPTSRIYFASWEVRLILPGLEALTNRLISASQGFFPDADPMYFVDHPEICGTPLDVVMAREVLSARNKLKTMNVARQPRLNSLEFAAAALALRVGLREKLAPGNLSLSPERLEQLAKKLENYRKRARNAAQKALGKEEYERLGKQWRRLLHWARYNIMKFEPRRRPSPASRLYREQREETRNLALSIVVDSADRKFISHLADLARREVRRGRHSTTLRKLLADGPRAEQFFTVFLMKRLGPEVLRPEFQPDCVRASALSEKAAGVLCVAR